MIREFRQLINGMMEIVQEVKYSNGRIVHRIMDTHTKVPKDIIVINPGRGYGA